VRSLLALLPALALLSAFAPAPARATEPAPAPTLAPAPVAGLELGTLVVGKTTFHEVRLVSRDARSLIFRHRGGLGSARLRDLPPELQQRLGYDAASAPPDEPPPRPAPARLAAPRAPATPSVEATTSPLSALFLAYDRAPELRRVQTLQPEFIRLGLAAKNQGRRPSCSVFAIVSALEFQNARLTGVNEKFSEEYLVWATRRSLGLSGPGASLLRDPSTGEFSQDAGFTLPSVISGLQTYGLPLYEDMRNQSGLAADRVPEPSPELVARARGRIQVFIARIPGREPALLIPRIVHALNAGFPVPVGLRWPHERSITAGVLSEQQPLPDASHAVTFVGYECRGDRIEDAVFIFKNSYGPQWGQGGYGRATWTYLSRNLHEAYVLDLRAPESS
jgi:hypothetical protein